MVIPTKGCRVLPRFKIRTQWRLLNARAVVQKCCSSYYKTLLQCVKFFLINPWDYEIFGAGVISLRPLQLFLMLSSFACFYPVHAFPYRYRHAVD